MLIVIDDENTNVVTAGAIVTVTVMLVRRNMSELFGDTTVADKEEIKYVISISDSFRVFFFIQSQLMSFQQLRKITFKQFC